MKSLGERLFAGLKNWRSRKKDVPLDKVPYVESETSAQSDQEPPERLSIKLTATDTDHAATRTSVQREPENPPEVLAPVDEPSTLGELSNKAEPPGEEKRADETSAAKLLRKRAPTEKPTVKATDRPVIDQGRSKPELKAVLPNEPLETESVADVGQPDQVLPGQGSAKVMMKDHGEDLRSTASAAIKPIDPPEMEATVEEPQVLEEAIRQVEPVKQSKEGAVENDTAVPSDNPRNKRSRARKPKSEDGPVTDKELADLQAENDRLKLLLDEKLKAKRDKSEN